MKKKTLIIICVIIFVVICLKSFGNISIRNTNISKKQWLEDITYLQNNLPKVHKNLFFNISSNSFNKEINDLKENLNQLNSDEITIHIMKIIASVGDAHTGIMNYKSNDIFPFTIYKFKDGYYLTEIDDIYKDQLGKKVLKIDNIPIEDIINKVSVLIPHANKYGVISQAPDYLQDTKVINYITNKKDNTLDLAVCDSNNKISEVNITSIKKSTLKMSSLSNNIINKPIYMKNNKNFWYEYLAGTKTLYCQFNTCVPFTPSSEDLSSINNIIKENKVKKVIIDLRNNTGGIHLSSNNALVNCIKDNKEINVKNKLFVIIGRETFSSGLMYAIDFKQQTNAIIYGEPTSGKPSGYGNIKNLILPNSKLNITYSTQIFNYTGFDSDTLKPDVEIDTDINSYINGIDPVVESIINNPK